MKSRYPSIAATVAVVVALSSGAYAVTLGRGVVKARNIKKGAVTAAKLRKDSVTSGKVQNRSLRAVDFKAGQLPRGEQGLQGVPGVDGTDGVDGVDGVDGIDGVDGVDGTDGKPGLSELEYVRTAFSNLAAGQTGVFTAVCPSGKVPVSGGFDANLGVFMRNSRPVSSGGSTTVDLDAWSVMIQNASMNGTSASGYVYALCAVVEGGFPNPGWSS